MTTVLVIAAHPDDDILGGGGTMAKYVDHGDDVHILLLSSGVGSRDDFPLGKGDEQAQRRKAATAAAAKIGANPPRFADFPDNQMDSVPLLKIVKTIETVVSEIVPRIVFTHHGGDLNIDHCRVHKATLAACRPVPGSPVEQVNAFEVLSSTEWATASSDQVFIPSRFVDITDQMERKIAALSLYGKEMRPQPHARSIKAAEAQALLRGNSIGVPCAEAFAVIRDVWKN